MTELWVELSGENPPLAAAEVAGACEALGGTVEPVIDAPPSALGVSVRLPDPVGPVRLAERLALARRILRPLPIEGLPEVAAMAGSAAFRPLDGAASPDDPLPALVARWKGAGGRIDLGDPDIRFWYARSGTGALWLSQEVAVVDRRRFRARSMPQLPYRRPVSLAPRLARAAANLARVRPGEWVVDPFLGTGALLAEAALLGARVAGVDREPSMVRGALTNFAHLGVELTEARVADAAETFPTPVGGPWDVVLTDPPYGRSSSSGGEAVGPLIERVLRAWAERVRPGGRLALVVPEGSGLGPGRSWELVATYPDRVHRSLTREFRWYRRPAS